MECGHFERDFYHYFFYSFFRNENLNWKIVNIFYIRILMKNVSLIPSDHLLSNKLYNDLILDDIKK